MKLSKETLEVLKNFVNINSSIYISEGKNLVTMSNSKTVLANAEIDEEFKQGFGIYDVGSFLSTLGLFDDPDIIFDNNKWLTVKESNQDVSCRFFFVDESIINKPTVNEITLQSEDLTFDIKSEDLSKILKASQVLSLEDIQISNIDDHVVVSALDSKNQSTNSYSLVVSDYTGGPDFELYIKTEKLKLLPGDYSVTIQAKGDQYLSYFNNKDQKAQYWIAIEAKSTFG